MCNKNNNQIESQGFTLVELSIVIIIIGFLIAAIAAGQSLVKQARLNSVLTEMQNYKVAYSSFRLRYHAIPGDMKNPEIYWAYNSSTPCSEIENICNGNGDKVVQDGNEAAAAWRELTLAGMINANIVPIPDGWGIDAYVIGSTIPESKISDAGYQILGSGAVFGNGVVSPWSDYVTNSVFISKVRPNESMANPVFKPEDAYNLDRKIDDGTVSGSTFSGALTGNFRTIHGVTYDACNTGNNYEISTTVESCVSGFALN